MGLRRLSLKLPQGFNSAIAEYVGSLDPRWASPGYVAQEVLSQSSGHRRGRKMIMIVSHLQGRRRYESFVLLELCFVGEVEATVDAEQLVRHSSCGYCVIWRSWGMGRIWRKGNRRDPLKGKLALCSKGLVLAALDTGWKIEFESHSAVAFQLIHCSTRALRLPNFCGQQ
ncbi:hypothetical protein BT69DRAFT_783781 [Atractiella rhizophila]|nr:hypothetical protein BT69DRAFT_783781 [Atractiella rhizophila]